jgi:hypothetical protein
LVHRAGLRADRELNDLAMGELGMDGEYWGKRRVSSLLGSIDAHGMVGIMDARLD